jgi:hypothetical protein
MTSRTIAILAAILTVSALAHSGQQAPVSGDRVVLVTIDGARTEEIFGGLDLTILESTVKAPRRAEATAAYQRFWAPTREERRRKLMPFFWSLVTDHGSIAGDSASGSVVRLTNRHWFSYPGYAEMLLGEPHDAEIKSNDRIRNPYPTVLEHVREQLHLSRGEVATFASWGVINEIAEHTPGATLVSAGNAGAAGNSELEARMITGLQGEALPPWDIMRFDVFTFRLAMNHLATARPRLLFMAFTETDDWAHDGRYDRVLDAYARTDRFLQELWTWLQNDADYRGRTHLLITTDHGRGRTPADWREHRSSVAGSGEAWMAFVSPRMAQRGVWRDTPPLASSQVAATIASWLGVDWLRDHPQAGQPIH